MFFLFLRFKQLETRGHVNTTMISSSLSKANVSSFQMPEDLSFAKIIQEDKELIFYIEAFLAASSSQLKRLEECYYYEKIENGNLLEALSEESTSLSIEEAIELVKSLAKHTYYQEEACQVYKVCKGHFNEAVKTGAPYRSAEHVQKIEQKILNEWKQKKEIKPESVTLQREQHRNLFFTSRLCDFYINYTHVDNCLTCSYPAVKQFTVQSLSFGSVMDQFENKIQKHNLARDLEWEKLAKRIFGKNLIIID